MIVKNEDRDNRQKVLDCMVKGPGPIYKLPPLIGYDGHDPSRHRNPAYTMRQCPPTKIYSLGHGPNYNVSKLTRYGPHNPPAYTLIGRTPWKLRDLGPGPGAYYPERCPPMNHNMRAPAYSMKSRSETRFIDEGPGPNTYSLPSCIGPNIPDKPAQAAYSIARFHDIKQEDIGPGPAAYRNLNYNLIKRRCPAYTLRSRHDLSEKIVGPGPRYYPQYKTGRKSPMFSFGVKHSECSGTPITELDAY